MLPPFFIYTTALWISISTLPHPHPHPAQLPRIVAVMEVISSTTRSSSPLNPNAPLFVPMAFRTVEDFSDQWWDLVHSSPWFRDYWLRERYQDPQIDDPDQDDFFHDHLQLHPQNVEEGGGDYHRELVSMGALKWRKGSGWANSPRYVQKAPKIVKARVSPRTIQQPR